jgi:hypothetical protein
MAPHAAIGTVGDRQDCPDLTHNPEIARSNPEDHPPHPSTAHCGLSVTQREYDQRGTVRGTKYRRLVLFVAIGESQAVAVDAGGGQGQRCPVIS